MLENPPATMSSIFSLFVFSLLFISIDAIHTYKQHELMRMNGENHVTDHLTSTGVTNPKPAGGNVLANKNSATGAAKPNLNTVAIKTGTGTGTGQGQGQDDIKDPINPQLIKSYAQKWAEIQNIWKQTAISQAADDLALKQAWEKAGKPTDTPDPTLFESASENDNDIENENTVESNAVTTTMEMSSLHRLHERIQASVRVAFWDQQVNQLLGVRRVLLWVMTHGGYPVPNTNPLQFQKPVPAAPFPYIFRADPGRNPEFTMEVDAVLNYDKVRSWSRNVKLDITELQGFLQPKVVAASNSGDVFATSTNEAILVKSMRLQDYNAFLSARTLYTNHIENSWDAARNTYSSKVMRLWLIVKFPSVYAPGQHQYWQVMVNGIPGGRGKWTYDPATGAQNCDMKHYRVNHKPRTTAVGSNCLLAFAANTNQYTDGLFDLERAALWNQFRSDYQMLSQATLIDHSFLLNVMRPTQAFADTITFGDIQDWGLIQWRCPTAGARPNPTQGYVPTAGSAYATALTQCDFHITGIIDIWMLFQQHNSLKYEIQHMGIAHNFNTNPDLITDFSRKCFQLVSNFFIRGPTDGAYVRSLWLTPGAATVADIRKPTANGNALTAGAFPALLPTRLTPGIYKLGPTDTGIKVKGIHPKRNGEAIWTLPIAKNNLIW